MALPNPHFEASYARVFGGEVGMDERADAFFASFYQRFLEAPDVARLFAGTDVARQVQMLKRSVFQLVSYYVVGTPSAELERLAALHQGLGLSTDLYDAWIRALVATAAEFDPDFDETTELAWCWALAPGVTYMQIAPGGDHVRAK